MRKLLLSVAILLCSVAAFSQYSSPHLIYEGNVNLTCGSTYRITYNKATLFNTIQQACSPPLIHELDFVPWLSMLDGSTETGIASMQLNGDGDNFYVDLFFPCLCGVSCYSVQVYFFPLDGTWIVGGPYQGSECPNSFVYRTDFTICGNTPNCGNCIVSNFFTDCDNSSCVKFTNSCASTCICANITYTDNTTSKHILHLAANSFLKLCTGKTVSSVSYATTTCTQCSSGNRMSNAENDEHITPPVTTRLQPVLFPNPADQRIYIKNQQYKGNSYLTIMDISGRVLLKKPVTTNGVDISSLQKGVYICELIENSKKILTQKIIKQ